jgi:hypothetical protein
MTKLQPPHGALHKRELKCSATAVRIVLHGAQNNKKARRPDDPRKVPYHQKGVSS